MRSLKIYLVLLLVSGLILGFGTACKKIPNGPSDPNDDDNGNGVKFASNVKVTYERKPPFDSADSYKWVCLNILTKDQIDWQIIQNKDMERIADNEFKSTIEKHPANIWLYAYTQDNGKLSVGMEFNAEIIKINGTRITDIRNHPGGNAHKVAFYKVNESGAVISEDF